MPGKISEKQQLILDYIKEEILKKGYPPTVGKYVKELAYALLLPFTHILIH